MSTTPNLSFERARYEGSPPPPDACVYCTRGLTGSYYRVGGHLACETCAQHAESLVPPDSHRAYSKAVMYGVAAAIAGCIGYALFEITTGIILAYAAIGVGFLVGWAMKRGSGGLGGRRYQITAALLTYAAVAVAFVPVALHEASAKNRGAQESTAQQSEAKEAQGAQSNAVQATGGSQGAQKHGVGTFLLAILMLLGLGLISPVLLLINAPGQGLFNLFIIFWGVRFAWKAMTSPRVAVEGPYTNTL